MHALRHGWLALVLLGAAGGCGGQAYAEPSGASGVAGIGGISGASGAGGAGAASGSGAAGSALSSAPPSNGGAAGSELGGDDDVFVRGCPLPKRRDVAVEECSDGVLHRTGPALCSSELPRADDPFLVSVTSQYLARGGDPAVIECQRDTDCTARPHGYCELESWQTRCNYGCQRDEECGERRICSCARPVGVCVEARCSSDASCPAGSACTQWSDDNCNGYGFSCETRDDECRTARECPDGYSCTQVGARRACTPSSYCPAELD
jgi:hypothetical protein